MRVTLLLSAPRTHIGGAEVWLHSFLTSALYGGELLPSSPGRFTRGENPGIHAIGDWVGPAAGVGFSGMRQIFGVRCVDMLCNAGLCGR